MEVELKAEASNRNLIRAVANTVVFMAVSKIKDDNVVQAMQLAKADSVDAWNEYQTDRLKLYISEQPLSLMRFQPATVQASDEAKAQVKFF
jgi:hypothetical protein